jgi:disulfide bond formation protein DsbB
VPRMAALALRLLRSPALVLGGVAAFSALALAGAHTAEHAFGLAPCILCLYQRAPFWAALAFAALGLAVRPAARLAVAACAVLFAGNAALAFYHAGVEQGWWASALEACALPGGVPLAEALAAPAVPCDVIPWADPVVGWSMAAWNVVACGVAAAGCAASAWVMRSERT